MMSTDALFEAGQIVREYRFRVETDAVAQGRREELNEQEDRLVDVLAAAIDLDEALGGRRSTGDRPTAQALRRLITALSGLRTQPKEANDA